MNRMIRPPGRVLGSVTRECIIEPLAALCHLYISSSNLTSDHHAREVQVEVNAFV